MKLNEIIKDPKRAIALAVVVIVVIAVIWISSRAIKKMVAGNADKKKQKEIERTYGSTTAGLDFDDLAASVYAAVAGTSDDLDAVKAVFNRLKNNADYERLKAAWKDEYKDWLGRYKTMESRLVANFKESSLKQLRSILDEKGITTYTI